MTFARQMSRGKSGRMEEGKDGRGLCCLNHGLRGLRGLRGLKEYGGRDRPGWDSDRDRVPIEDLDSKSLN